MTKLITELDGLFFQETNSLVFYDYGYDGNLTRRRHGALTACVGSYSVNGTCGTAGTTISIGP